MVAHVDAQRREDKHPKKNDSDERPSKKWDRDESQDVNHDNPKKIGAVNFKRVSECWFHKTS